VGAWRRRKRQTEARLSDAKKGTYQVSKRTRKQPLAGREKGLAEAGEDVLCDSGASGAQAVGGKGDSLEDGTAGGIEHEVSKKGTVFAPSVGEAQTPEVKAPEVGAGEEPSEEGGGQIAEEERQLEESAQKAEAPDNRAFVAWTEEGPTAEQE
jgi:hypothetical protein